LLFVIQETGELVAKILVHPIFIEVNTIFSSSDNQNLARIVMAIPEFLKYDPNQQFLKWKNAKYQYRIDKKQSLFKVEAAK
jgi:hypothetical protein